jgi:uncharacterized membrane protein
MDFDWNQWLQLALRWVHIFSAILWVGTTYYFTWLDGRMSELEKAGAGAGAGQPGPQVWMVHSGGFYKVDKTKVWDTAHHLHWFRWEAAITWLSGIALLVQVYYLGGLMVDESVATIGTGTAVLIGVATWFLGWGVYDGMMKSPLGRNEKAAAVVGFLLVCALAFGLSRWLSGRAVYLHVGALFGTIMANNVWMRILPGQRRMVAAVREGRAPDPAWGASAKLRSKQNTFLAVPTVFLMTSVHFPTITYGHRYGWVVLCAMVLVGWAVARWVRRA